MCSFRGRDIERELGRENRIFGVRAGAGNATQERRAGDRARATSPNRACKDSGSRGGRSPRGWAPLRWERQSGQGRQATSSNGWESRGHQVGAPREGHP
eukprot:scaffold584_cov338-Pavlova_lutheri.AAC.1